MIIRNPLKVNKFIISKVSYKLNTHNYRAFKNIKNN